MNGTISVVIPVFNGEEFLPGAIENVLQQDVPSVEIIVVNDGSRDRTDQVAKDYADRIIYLSQENRGPSAARNLGLTRAKGDYIAFLDCDDRWPVRNLSTLRDALDADSDIVLGRIQEQCFDPRQQRWVNRGKPIFSLSLVAMLTRRSTFDDVGPLNEMIRIGEDKDWFYRAREKHKRITCLENHLSLYHRRHDHNTTNTMGAPEPILLDLMRRSLRRRGVFRSDVP
jgi:glycosyltransferase involved in cell wall biosynthesis